MSYRKLHPGQIQNWQAVGILRGGKELLITLGTSITDVSRRYYDSLAVIADHDVLEVELRRWEGDALSGRWLRIQSIDPSTLTQEVTAA